jgi:hypothetical protein
MLFPASTVSPVLETLEEPSKTLDVLFCFTTPEVQSHEIEGLKATDGL